MAADSLSTGLLMHLKLKQPNMKKERKSFFLVRNNVLNTNPNNGKAFSPSLVSFNNCSIGVTKFSSSAAETAAVAPVELGVGEIKEKCKKWLWKGQFSINYLVSHPHEGEEEQNLGSDSNSKPPLLLVHGFGASIPHWRRFVSRFINALNVDMLICGLICMSSTPHVPHLHKTHG